MAWSSSKRLGPEGGLGLKVTWALGRLVIGCFSLGAEVEDQPDVSQFFGSKDFIWLSHVLKHCCPSIEIKKRPSI